MNSPKILLAHLNSRGDCLYATVIARQIKEEDYKGCRLTWAVNSRCKEVLLNNPYIDEIWEIPTKAAITTPEEWKDFIKLAEARKSKGEFDLSFYTMIIGENISRFDGGIRSSIYNNYPHRIIIKQQPVLRLWEAETNKVGAFALLHQLQKYKQVILVECGPESFISHLNQNSALEMARNLLNNYPNTAIILSSNKKIGHSIKGIIDGSELSFRENAELTKYCTLFVGCSSGISWLTTTNWAKPLPKIILTDYNSRACTSMVYDHEYAGMDSENIIEFQENDQAMEKLFDTIGLVITKGFEQARMTFKKPAKLKNYSFIYHAGREAIKRKHYSGPLKAYQLSMRRNGFQAGALLNLLKVYAKLPIFFAKAFLQSAEKNRNKVE